MTKFDHLSLHIPSSDNPRIVIAGGGFGGISLAKGLVNKGFQVVLLDRNNYHTFQPLLYQVATAGLEPDSIAGPLRKLIQNHKDFYFRMTKVLRVNPEQHTVTTLIGELTYDYLVIACGSKTNYFGNEENVSEAFPLKQVPQALDLRSHILQNFEQAVMTTDQTQLETLLNIVIVGGGPTGVEVAGALAELREHILPKDYPELDILKMQIYLVEGLTSLLQGMDEKSGRKALKYLEKFGVEVILNKRVQSFDGSQVCLDDGRAIPSQTLIWAAGVTGNLIEGFEQGSLENGRLLVDVLQRVEGTDTVFAIGDIALMKTDAYPSGHPMLAPVAIQQGKNLAKNLVKMRKNKPLKPFKYQDKGVMATIGRNKAVVNLPGGIQFGGRLAWFVWMLVHLVSLVGFRNKLIVLSNWIWNYLTYDRGTRLIIRLFNPVKKNK